jgi:1,2-diacylglycerol 3-alpha-glucosyltransferase
MPSTNTSSHPKLNILFIADIIDGGKSGGVISARRLIDYLKQQHNLTIVSTGNAEKNKIVMPEFYLPFVKRIMQEMGFIFAWPKVEILKKAIKNADIVHIQFPFLLGYKALSIARKMGKPVALGYHVQPENLMWNIGVHNTRVISTLYRFFVKSFYNKGNLVLSPSAFGKTMLEKNGIKVPVKVISNGLPPQFKPGNYEFDPDFADKFIVLMAGRYAKEKRHDIVFKALSLSKHKDNIQVIVTGKGPMRKELEELAAKMGLAVLFTYVSQEELIRYFNIAHLFVHASEVELEGMAVLEAIGCGLPALIADSAYSASSQFALNEKFLFASGDVDDLSSRIDYWFEHRNELEASKQQYLEKAHQYSFALSVQKTVDSYRDLLAKANAS